MTTPITINDISDLARILRERPEWLDVIRSIVIGEELLSVPQQLAKLTQRVDVLTQRVDDLTQQVNDLTQRLNEFIQITNENFRLVNERLERLEAGQAELRGDVTDLRADFARLEGRFSNLEGRFSNLEGRFSNFEGSDYERRVRNRLISRSVFRFDLVRPAIVMTQDSQSSPEFNSVVQRAIRSGSITMTQFEDMHEADIIIRDEENRYLLAEVSITADNEDIERAVRRSQVLATAADANVLPALVAANVPEPQRELADAQGVSLFIIPYP